MALKVHDFEDDVFTGPGRIEVKGEHSGRFFLHGKAGDAERALRRMREATENPYDHLSQFRLFVTDYQGVDWNAGFTELDRHTARGEGWLLSGKIRDLTTVATGCRVSRHSSVELLLAPPIHVPTSEPLTSVSRIGDETLVTEHRPGRHRLEVLGSTVEFAYEPSGEALWITARTNDRMQHPQLEGWLTEPLRILLGGPVYPRLVARNFGDGTAFVSLRPGSIVKHPSLIALCSPFERPEAGAKDFWSLYADILGLIAKAGSFERHELTSYYDELAQARLGTTRVLTMTLASAAEALARGLMSEENKRSEFSHERLRSMKSHIQRWKEDTALQERLLSMLSNLKKRSVFRFLRDLASAGAVNEGQVQTWRAVRDAVMHGSLVEPWATQEGERRLSDMLELVHSLTRERIARGK